MAHKSDEEMTEFPYFSGSQLEVVHRDLKEMQDIVFELAFSASPANRTRDGPATSPFLEEQETGLEVAHQYMLQARNTLEKVQEHVYNRPPHKKREDTSPDLMMSDSIEGEASGSNTARTLGKAPMAINKSARTSTAAAAPPAPSSPSAISILSELELESESESETARRLDSARLRRNSREPIYFTHGDEEVPGYNIPAALEAEVNDTIKYFFQGDRKLEGRCIAQRIAGQGTAKVGGDERRKFSCGDCEKKNKLCIAWQQRTEGKKEGFIVRARYERPDVRWKN